MEQTRTIAEISMPDWTAQDFTQTDAPYAWAHAFRGKPFVLQQALSMLYTRAAMCGVKNAKKLWAAYLEQYGEKVVDITIGETYTEFPGQPMRLVANGYKTSASGITTPGRDGFDVQVCPCPIMPVRRLKNVDTEMEKIELAYSRDGKWKTLIRDRTTLASANSIVALSGVGIPVTSANATELVKYLNALDVDNYTEIPKRQSIGRMGWVTGHGFSPYTGNLVFDADENFGTIYKTVCACGSFDAWRDTVGEVRRKNKWAQMILAASFASVLVEPLGALPFFVHLWSTSSGTGKTVALMCAASVWADPSVGKYIQTFNSTVVGLERYAAFCNSLPLIIDEMQLARDASGKSRFNVYQLAQGVGRTRGNNRGGTDYTATWHNCIITSGETPLTADSAGAGAKNRVLEIGCGEKKVVSDGWRVSETLRTNYGHAGKLFVQRLMEPGAIEKARAIYADALKSLLDSDATDKQAANTAILITADKLAQEWIFTDGQALCAADFSADDPEDSVLETKDSVDIGRRAYEFLKDWVALNGNRFRVADANNPKDVPIGELYGVIEEDVAYINKTVLAKALEGEGYSAKGTLKWLKTRGLLRVRGDGKGYYYNRKVDGRAVAHAAVYLDEQRQADTDTLLQSVFPL